MLMEKLSACFLALALIVVVLPFSSKAITDVPLTVSVTISSDGSAHILETYSFFLDTDKDIDEFSHLQSFSQNTIASWRQFVPRLRYHVGGPAAPSNTKISARRLLNVGFRSASLELEYDISAPLFTEEKIGSRLSRYSLNPSFLSFDSTATGEIILSTLDFIEFKLPARAKIEPQTLSPKPTDLREGYASWAGPVSSKWKFSYTMEESLEDEVKSFFDELYRSVSALVPTLLPFALVLLILGFLASKLAGRSK